MHKIEGAHLQCVKTHNAKFDYKGMKTAKVTDYTNQTPLSILDIGRAHLQCMNKHYAKFEYKGMKTFGVTDYTNKAPQKCCSRTDRVEMMQV